jgi:hypothetical protein
VLGILVVGSGVGIPLVIRARRRAG